MSGRVGLSRIEVEFLLLGCVVEVAAEDQSSELVVLQSVHQDLLVSLVALIVEDQDSSETIKDATLFEVIIELQVLIDSIRHYSMNQLFLLKFDAAVQSPFDDLLHNLLIIDQYLVVDADLIEEVRSADSLVEMRDDVGNVLHEDVLCLHVVEAEQGEVLVDREEQPSVDLWQFLLSDDLDVL